MYLLILHNLSINKQTIIIIIIKACHGSQSHHDNGGK
jgi:hypothetical protein